jgi:hypothetical protein
MNGDEFIPSAAALRGRPSGYRFMAAETARWTPTAQAAMKK